MKFGQALEAMSQGKRVARSGWNGKGMWICLGQGMAALPAEKFWNVNTRIFAEENGGTAEVLPYLIMKTADDKILMGWLASQTDMLADDWVELPRAEWPVRQKQARAEAHLDEVLNGTLWGTLWQRPVRAVPTTKFVFVELLKRSLKTWENGDDEGYLVESIKEPAINPTEPFKGRIFWFSKDFFEMIFIKDDGSRFGKITGGVFGELFYKKDNSECFMSISFPVDDWTGPKWGSYIEFPTPISSQEFNSQLCRLLKNQVIGLETRIAQQAQQFQNKPTC